MSLEVEHLSFWYKTFEPPIIYDCTFALVEGEFLAIVGSSGCGKSTLLRLCSGLLQAELKDQPKQSFRIDGTIRFKGKMVARPDEAFAYVPQSFNASLIPRLTALDNILVAVRAEGVSREEVKEAEWLMRACGISDVGRLRASELSGGQQQRVAICRALIKHPKVLYMDEPFANLDPTLKPGMATLMNELRRRYTLSVLIVTHDLNGAISLADRVLAARREYDRPQYMLSNTSQIDAKALEQWFG